MGFVRECNDEFAFICQEREIKLANMRNKWFSIEILTTTDCNARCFYCYQHGIAKEHMSIETADKIVQYILKNYNGREVALKWFGGEPLYNASIINHICRELQKRDIQYSSRMITNAYLVNTYIDEIKGLWNLRAVQVTLDAVCDEYNKVKNYIYDPAENSFERIITNIELLLDAGVTVTIRINFDPSKIDDTIRTVKYVHRRFGNPKGLNVYCAPIVAKNVPSISDYSGSENPYIVLFDVLIDCGYINSLEEMDIFPQILNCGVFNKEFFTVDTAGRLHKCQHAIIEGENDAFGDVENGITNEEKHDRWLSLAYPLDECRECICLPLCQGGCRHRALSGDYHNLCHPLKNSLKELLVLYYRKLGQK
jgi:radical SAM protein with 4Fe4S-binding SPASM domain